MKRARDVREQLLGLMDRTEVALVSDVGNHDNIRKALASGFFYHTANLQKNGSYRTVKSPMTVHIHPSSGLNEVGFAADLSEATAASGVPIVPAMVTVSFAADACVTMQAVHIVVINDVQDCIAD